MDVMLAASRERILAGALLGVFATPLVMLGYWHVYQGLKPAGQRASLGPFLLLLLAYVLAPFAHGAFYFIGDSLHMLSAAAVDQQDAVFDQFNRYIFAMFAVYLPLLLVYLVGCVWMSLTIFKGKSAYPRWFAFCNPIIFIVLFAILGPMLPGLAGRLVSASLTNLGGLLFFGLSTHLLWAGIRKGEKGT